MTIEGIKLSLVSRIIVFNENVLRREKRGREGLSLDVKLEQVEEDIGEEGI